MRAIAIACGLMASVACTPPEAKTPEASGSSKSNIPSAKDGDDGDGGGDQIPLPDDADLIKEAKGVNLGRLTDPQQTTFFQVVNTEVSPCKRTESLAKSLRDDETCRDSMVVAQFVADSLAMGATPTQIREAIDKLVDALDPKDIPIEGRPVYGSETAPVTVVVFADFECPHCRDEAPKLRATIDQFRGRAKLVYKHFPLEFHERAKQAAVATEAAHDQGKFWAMHDIVFAHQTELSDEDLLRYAEQIGLDMAKFKASLSAPAGLQRVEADRKDGEALELGGTPTVFVNGRLMVDVLFGGTLSGWIDDALKR